jgi:ABC-type multidrug transport system fused ATPase/permease subunit
MVSVLSVFAYCVFQIRSSNEQIRGLQQKTENVKDVQRQNIARLQEREQKLDDLDERADNLQMNAKYFKRGAQAVQRKLWWQNVKLWIILFVIIGVIIFAIIIIIIIAVCASGSCTSSQ